MSGTVEIVTSWETHGPEKDVIEHPRYSSTTIPTGPSIAKARPQGRGDQRLVSAPFPGKQRLTIPVVYTYFLWVVMSTSVHRWLADRGPHITAMHSAIPVLMVPLIGMILFHLPTRFRTTWAVGLAPILGLVIVGVFVSSRPLPLGWCPHPWWPFPQTALDQLKILAQMFLLGVGTVMFLNTPRRVVTLVILYVGQYWWWGWHSGTTGAVWWHPNFANFDDFAGLVVYGLPLCLGFGLAAKAPFYKWGGLFLGAYCALAVVTSFARGAILSAMAVGILFWIRSPRHQRLRVSLAILVGMASFLATSAILHPGGGMVAEVQSVFTEGKDEGTGRDRWDLWTAAIKVWQTHPLVGVGPLQTGATATHMILGGEMEMEGNYGEYPWRLHGRAIHNTWVQLLAEFGLIGTALMLFLFVDFWRRNTRLRQPDAILYWARLTEGRFRLDLLVLGIEGAMVGIIATGMFYNFLFSEWLYAIIILNLALSLVAVPRRSRVTKGRLPEHRRAVLNQAS